ncbi:hypothetical protein IKP85_05485 [bacterium]|nr:hypothetical protein [bacterium]
MYYGEYGNYESRTFDRSKDYELYQLGREKKAAADAQASQVKTVINFPKSAEARSTDALGAYGKASFNISQKVTASALPLTDEVQAMVGRFITPEQEQRVSANFLNYFG